MKSKLILSAILWLLFPVFIGGCRDSIDVDELAIVIGVGVDRIPGKEPILVTVQIVNPAAAKSPGEGGGGQEQPFTVLISQGKSFFEAIRNLAATSPRRLFFAHNRMVVLGKAFAESDISEAMDYMDRDREFRRINWILVTEGTAKEVLEAKMDIEKLPAQGVFTMLTSEEQTSVYPVNRNEFLLQLKSDSRVSYAPLIRLQDMKMESNIKLKQVTGKPLESPEAKSTNKIHLQQMAIFKDNRLIGILSEEESKGFLWLINKLNGDTVVIPYTSDEGEQEITLDIIEGKSKLIPHITAKGITMEIVCTGTAALREAGSLSMETANLKIYQQLGQEAANILKARIEQTIVSAQTGLKADFLGFANRLHDYNPVEWKRIKKDWDQRFPAIKSDVAVQVTIQKMGKIKSSATLKDRGE